MACLNNVDPEEPLSVRFFTIPLLASPSDLLHRLFPITIFPAMTSPSLAPPTPLLPRCFFLLVAWSFLTLSPPAAKCANEADDVKTPPLVRCFAQTKSPSAPFDNGKFAPKPGETISFIGGTNTFDLQKYPYQEILLQLAYPNLNLKIRNLVWQGDTVLRQVRPRFYFTEDGDKQPGSLPDQRDHVSPGIVFVNFGKMESLEGADSLANFLSAYETFLDQLQTRTQRIVLLAPTPFFPVGPAKNQSMARNKTLAEFESAIRAVASKRKFLYVDQFNPLLESLDPGLSYDGIHLTDAGQKQVARITAQALHFPLAPDAALNSSKLQTLHQALLRKDFLWQQYYHPTNWAFLYGDRQSQPASRSHLDKDKRWFRTEVGQLPGLINETETDIHRYAAEAAASISK